jgi:hypothetical protein
MCFRCLGVTVFADVYGDKRRHPEHLDSTCVNVIFVGEKRMTTKTRHDLKFPLNDFFNVFC